MGTFNTGYLNSPISSFAGELIGSNGYQLGYDRTYFDNGLTIGTYLWFDPTTKKFTNAYASGVLPGGVYMRELNNAFDVVNLENKSNDYTQLINIVVQGIVTILVKDNEKPNLLSSVYVDTTTGEAVASAGDSATLVNAKFVQPVTDKVWQIYIDLL